MWRERDCHIIDAQSPEYLGLSDVLKAITEHGDACQSDYQGMAQPMRACLPFFDFSILPSFRLKILLFNIHLVPLMEVRSWMPSDLLCGMKGVTGLGKPVELFLLTLMLVAGSDWAGMGANHKPWRWGSGYCAGQRLWGSLADPMDRAQHQNNTTQNVTQTFHRRTDRTSTHLKPPHPGSESCLVWHTLNKIRSVRSPSQAFLQGNGRLEDSGPLGFCIYPQDFWTLTYKMLVRNGDNYRLCYEHNTVISFYWNSVYNSGCTCIKSFFGQQWTEFCSQIRRIPPNNCSIPHRI